MANGGKITTTGLNNALNRAYKSTPDYTAPYQFKVGIGYTTPTTTDTDLEIAVPITNGTVNDDGDNQLTGSSGGDNTTDNTTTYKPGAGLTDNTAQNLIANNTATTKIWTIADLATNGNDVVSTQFIGQWLYIKDAAALAKIVSVEFKYGEDSSNYYSITTLVANLAVGWNWITGNTDTVADLDETGTVTGDLDTFIIEIVTNNATDTFVAGDVIYDLLRQWETSDLFKTFVSGYPTLDEVNIRSTIRCYLTTLEANGFLLREIAIYNNDGTPILLMRDVYDEHSKSSTDEFAYVLKDEMEEGT